MSTVELNEATVRKYISDQEKHDIAIDKLSVKEYEDTFKGSKKHERPLRAAKEATAIGLNKM